MTTSELVKDLKRLGIRLEAHGDRLRYSPRSAVTPDVVAELKRHKGDLLAILRSQIDTPAIDLTDATAVWNAVLDRVEGSALFPPSAMEALRSASVRWENDVDNGPVQRTASQTDS